MKTLIGEDKESFIQFSNAQNEEIRVWIKTYIQKQIESMDGIIKDYAIKLTASVLVSPNPFIDGITILYGNSCMIYKLTQKVKIRYTWKELWDMYFAVMSVASISGLLEEFDDVIEDIFEDIAEEFSDFIREETGKTIGDSIPILNILIKASGPIIQAAGNYAFILYNGKRYKYKLMNLVSDEDLTEDEIRKKARKEARKAKYQYIEDMVKKLGLNGTTKIKKSIGRVFHDKRSDRNEEQELGEVLESKVLEEVSVSDETVQKGKKGTVKKWVLKGKANKNLESKETKKSQE